jgi:hypothetical protein
VSPRFFGPRVPVFPVFPCLPSRVEHSTSPPLSYLDDISLSGARNLRPQVSREEREHRGYRIDLLRPERGFPLAHRHLSSRPLNPPDRCCLRLTRDFGSLHISCVLVEIRGRRRVVDWSAFQAGRVNTLAAQGCVGWTWGSEVVGNRARLFHTGLWFPGE